MLALSSARAVLCTKPHLQVVVERVQEAVHLAERPKPHLSTRAHTWRHCRSQCQGSEERAGHMLIIVKST